MASRGLHYEQCVNSQSLTAKASKVALVGLSIWLSGWRKGTKRQVPPSMRLDKGRSTRSKFAALQPSRRGRLDLLLRAVWIIDGPFIWLFGGGEDGGKFQRSSTGEGMVRIVK